MKTKEVWGVIHDFLKLHAWENPVSRIWIKNNLKLNLISGEISYLSEDDLTDFYTKKRNWFINRVMILKNGLKDMALATVEVYGKKEKIEIIFKGKKFEGEKIY